MDNTFEELCKKHNLTSEAIVDFKHLFEKQIVDVFYKVSKSRSGIEKSKENNEEVKFCKAKKTTGENCTFKAKEGGEYCGRHSKTTTEKKVGKQTFICNGKTGKGDKCETIASVKPDNSVYHYCKRHSDNWEKFEEEYDESKN